MITLVFPDGSIITGKTWREVEMEMRATQWLTYKSRRTFRQDMRTRAFRWSGIPVKAGRMGAERFIRSLADAQMFLLVFGEDEYDWTVA